MSTFQLAFQDQKYQGTLREGIEEYHCYLRSLGRKIGTDQAHGLWTFHDATHVIFGHDTTLEQEASLDFCVYLQCHFKWRDLVAYNGDPIIQALFKSLISELGYTAPLVSYWRNRKVIWRIFRRSRHLKKKWPFTFPEEWLDRSVKELRDEHGIVILNTEEKHTDKRFEWSGQY